MRRAVCLITKDYPPNVPGGISRAVQMQAHALARAGTEVHVITAATSTGEPLVRDDGGAMVHEVVEPGLAVPGDFAYFEIGTWSRTAAAKCRELDATVRFDIVETPDYRGEALHIEKRPETKLIVWLHSIMATAWKHNPGHVTVPWNRAWHALEVEAMQRADLLLAPSRLVLDETRDVVDRPLPDAELMPYLFDASAFAPSGPRGAGEKVKVLFYGRLEERKNPELALLAVAAARARGLDVELTLAGRDNGGHQARVLAPLQSRLGLDDVRYIPHVDVDGVRTLLAESDCAILPSRFDNSPLTVLEALSSGLPVITSDKVGIATWVGAEDGLLSLPIDDAEAFAERAADALCDREWLRDGGARAAVRLREVFEPNATVERLLDCYRRLLGETPAPQRIAGTRDHTVLALADELADDGELLASWARSFTGEDPITLVIYAPDHSETDVAERLSPALTAAGLDSDGGPDLMALAVPRSSELEGTLAGGAQALLTRRTPAAPFDRLRRVGADEVAALRDLLPLVKAEASAPARERVSGELRAFVNECPNERASILDHMLRVADELAPGSHVLDVGAGEQPYRELFSHVDYVTSDWANSVHPGAHQVDIVAPADDLPVEDGSFDAVINTQVLEHVPEPGKVLAELFRVLRPGGRAYITLPLAWELHEEPYDFYRYTRYGISHLLREAGFEDIDVKPRNDCFTTIAQLMRNTNHAMGRAGDGLDLQRDQAAAHMRQMADVVEGFAPLDSRWILPLGYAATATKPA